MPIAVALGVVVYVVYVVNVGGDFMRGRFFTLPILAAVVLLLHVETALRPRWAIAVLLVVLVWSVLIPSSPLRTDPGSYRDLPEDERFLDGHGIADERSFYFRDTSPMLADDRGEMPAHEWADWGGARATSEPRGSPWSARPACVPSSPGLGYTSSIATDWAILSCRVFRRTPRGCGGSDTFIANRPRAIGRP